MGRADRQTTQGCRRGNSVVDHDLISAGPAKVRQGTTDIQQTSVPTHSNQGTVDDIDLAPSSRPSEAI